MTEQITNLDSEKRGTRVGSLLRWLRGRSDTAVGRLALAWFRGYFAASRNSGCAVTVYSSLSVLPAVLVALASLHPSQDNANAFAERLVDHLNLTGATASLVDATFGSASANALAATISVVISFLLWGIGIGQIYQDVYARAWRLKVGSLADQGMFVLFFFVLTGAISLWLYAAAGLRTAGWLALIPAWFIGSTVFWLFVPRWLLHGKVPLRALLPGALLASFLIGGTVGTSPLWISPTMNQNGKAFGSFGVVLTLIGFVFIVMTMSLACAVFSPVWAKWRDAEKRRKEESA